MNVMNLFSTTPQIQADSIGDSMTGNWQSAFQHAMKQDISNTPFHQTSPKEKLESLNIHSLLEMFGLSEEDLIDLLQSVNEIMGTDQEMQESDMIALLEAYAKINDENNTEGHLDECVYQEMDGSGNKSNEIAETTLNKQALIKDLLMRLLSHNDTDYDEFLESMKKNEVVDAAMLEQMRQFILALKEMKLNAVDMQDRNSNTDAFQSSIDEFFNKDYEGYSELYMQTNKANEIALEDQMDSIQNELMQLITEINRLLDGFMEKGTDLPRNILQILNRWAQLQEEAPTLVSEVKEKLMSEKDSKIWQQLVQTYEKRQSFSKQLIYQTESSISKQDVHRWLEQAFSRYDQVASHSQSTSSLHQTMIPMKEIQQFDIHLQATNRVEKISNELITQLTNVIQKSNFIQGRQMNQLTISLNPENLGNITVRLLEVDGEMTVKLLVTSSLTKKALETNIHQLKHMFSPHQISIEREEGISDDEFFADEEALEDESLEEDNESEEKEEEKPEIDFEELLQQIREGEEVNDEN